VERPRHVEGRSERRLLLRGGRLPWVLVLIPLWPRVVAVPLVDWLWRPLLLWRLLRPVRALAWLLPGGIRCLPVGLWASVGLP
jgi:hypothetical protein